MLELAFSWQSACTLPPSGLELAADQCVASIRVRVRNGRHRVTVRGQLQAEDLRRLERACGRALEHRTLPLELRVRDVVSMDESAQLFVDSLVRRGAVLT